MAIDLTLAPSYLASLWGIGEDAAGLVLSIAIILSGVILVAIATSKQNNTGTMAMYIGVLLTFFTASIGWLSPWIVVLLVIILGLLYYYGDKP